MSTMSPRAAAALAGARPLPFWTDRMGYAERSVNLRKEL